MRGWRTDMSHLRLANKRRGCWFLCALIFDPPRQQFLPRLRYQAPLHRLGLLALHVMQNHRNIMLLRDIRDSSGVFSLYKTHDKIKLISIGGASVSKVLRIQTSERECLYAEKEVRTNSRILDSRSRAKSEYQ